MLMINLFAWPVLGSGRFLHPVTVDLAALDAIPPRLVGYKLHEEMRGALPFYTGLIVRNLQSPGEVSRYAQENPSGFLLTASPPPPFFPMIFPTPLERSRFGRWRKGATCSTTSYQKLKPHWSSATTQ